MLKDTLAIIIEMTKRYPCGKGNTIVFNFIASLRKDAELNESMDDVTNLLEQFAKESA